MKALSIKAVLAKITKSLNRPIKVVQYEWVVSPAKKTSEHCSYLMQTHQIRLILVPNHLLQTTHSSVGFSL